MCMMYSWSAVVWAWPTHLFEIESGDIYVDPCHVGENGRAHLRLAQLINVAFEAIVTRVTIYINMIVVPNPVSLNRI